MLLLPDVQDLQSLLDRLRNLILSESTIGVILKEDLICLFLLFTVLLPLLYIFGNLSLS
jgi:hypothetical protein